MHVLYRYAACPTNYLFRMLAAFVFATNSNTSID